MYTFKKKIERGDKILRDFIQPPNAENETKDIINIALEEADIGQITYIDDSIYFGKEKFKNDNDNFLQLPSNILTSEANLGEPDLITQNILIDLNPPKFVKDDILESIPILTDCLPPLIPITTIDNIDMNNFNRALPQDPPPPLVPIKPLDLKILEDVISPEYTCYICSEKFSNISNLKAHRLTKCKPKDLQCTVCLKEFDERNKLIGHLKGHMVVKDHMCRLCGKKYPNPSTFKVHMRSHTGERPFKCHICNKGFTRWAGVRLHQKTHEDKRPFCCNVCPKAFKISSNLERHKKTHSRIEPYNCSICKKSYSQLENLNLHILTFHTDERPFLCNICGKGYVNSTRLKRHMWVHSGHKPFKCHLCPKAYFSKTDLRNHQIYHLGKNSNALKNYACDQCDMRFFHPCRLAKHKKVHEKEVKCELCDRTFKSRALYTTHLSRDHGFDECVEESLSVQYYEIVETMKNGT